LRNREFAAVAVTQVLSQWGDQIARVAVASLVLDVTGSATASAAIFAVSLLPDVLGIPLLGPLADRLPRRELCVAANVVQAALVGVLIAVAGVAHSPPLVAVLALILVIELAGSPTGPALSSMQADIFEGHGAVFLSGQGLLRVLSQVDQVIGLVLGGAAVAVFGLTGALWVDLGSFVAGAALITVFVRRRPAAAPGGVRGLSGLVEDLRSGARGLGADRRLRLLLWLACVSSVAFVAPEAVALPYAMRHGGGPAQGGLLLAAVPLGAVVSVYIVGRWTPRQQVSRMVVLAMLSTLPMLAAIWGPRWQFALALWFACGLCQGYMVPLMSTYMLLGPVALRGRLNGFAGAMFGFTSAATYLGAGALADWRTPQFAVAAFGGLALLALILTTPRWPRAELALSADRVFSR
jgi:MFS family permease